MTKFGHGVSRLRDPRRASATFAGALAPKDVFSQVWTSGLAVLGLASGAAQLAATGKGKLVLVSISLIALLFLTGRLLRLAAARSLTEELAAREKLIGDYRKALRRVVNRPVPQLLEENISIVMTIGTDSDGDRIIERHRTTVEPSLLYRIIRPVCAPAAAFSEMSFVARSLSCDVRLSVLPLTDELDPTWLMVIFHPEQAGVLEWEVEYWSPRLWDPLRRNGIDSLRWSSVLERELAVPDHITRFEMQLIFPRSARGTWLSERGAKGRQVKDELPTGQGRIVWTDDCPSTQRYEWQISATFDAE